MAKDLVFCGSYNWPTLLWNLQKRYLAGRERGSLQTRYPLWYTGRFIITWQTLYPPLEGVLSRPVNLHQYIVRQVGAVCTTLMFSDCHDDITEILLKVALNSKHHTSKTSLVKICTFNICSNFNVHNIPINIKTTRMTYTIVPKVCHLKKPNPIVYSHVFYAKTTIFSFACLPSPFLIKRFVKLTLPFNCHNF